MKRFFSFELYGVNLAISLQLLLFNVETFYSIENSFLCVHFITVKNFNDWVS